VLEKIHQDEIGHVGHGLKWFRRWKDAGEGDWQAYRRQLVFPLTAVRAKGTAPFNAESRRMAGLDEEFIRELEVFEHSRGRTPTLHWFNPNAEGHARAAATGGIYQPDKTALALEHDLEILLLGCCRRDDAVLLRQTPSAAHLGRLKQAGFPIPEILTIGDAHGRKLGGLRPWAWSPDAAAQLQPLAGEVAATSEAPWRPAIPHHWLSKQIGLELEAMLGGCAETGIFHRDAAAVLTDVARYLESGQVLLKAPYSCAGRGHLRVNHASDPGKTHGWIANTLAAHGGIVVERWLERVADFSALYEVKPGGAALLGLTHLENDPAGRFLGIRVGPKWGSMLEPALADYLFGEARVMDWYGRRIPALLPELLAGYVGPVCVDALVHRRGDGSLALKPVVELNVRLTMGRVAWEWLQRSPNRAGGRLRILRRAGLDAVVIAALHEGPGVVLNDPESAAEFLAYWLPEG
jgi:hypothetical protein